MTNSEKNIICKKLVEKYGLLQIVVAIEELSELKRSYAKV